MPGNERVDQLPELTDVIRRVVGARVHDRHDVEDLVQETLVKLAAARPDLAPDALQGYAIVTARHLTVEHGRRDERRKRHIHRMVEYTSLAGPEELTLQAEETDALAVALERLPAADRELLLDHEVNGISTGALAERSDSTAGAVAVRLARARASLRLEFLLAFRHVELPDARCRSVLLAISAGDRRRQAALHAEQHLSKCRTCAGLSQPLVERRRSIAGLLPLFGLSGVAAACRRWLRSGKAQATAGVSAAAVAGVAAFVALHGAGAAPAARPPAATAATVAIAPSPSTAPPSTAPPPTSPVTSGGVPLLPVPPGGLAAFAGHAADGQDVAVIAVPADEGFWVGLDDHQKIWVQLVGSGESPYTVRVGDRVTFDGTVTANQQGMARSAGIPSDQIPPLALEGAHLEVAYGALHITRS